MTAKGWSAELVKGTWNHPGKWQTYAQQPLGNHPVAFRIDNTTATLSEDQGTILAYYRSKKADPFLKKQLDLIFKDSRNVALGKGIVNGEYLYPTFPAVKISSPTPPWKDDRKEYDWHWYNHQLIVLRYLIAADAASDRPGSSIYMDKIKAIVESWTRENYVPNLPSIFSWHDQCTAFRLRNLFMLFEYVRRTEKDDKFLVLLLRLIHTHCLVLADDAHFKRHMNHGYDQAYILLWTTMIFPEMQDASRFHAIAFARLQDEIGFMFTPEGVHVENSPGYEYTMLLSLTFLQELYRGYDNIQAADGLSPMIDKVWGSLAFILRPDGTLPLIGDTDYNKPSKRLEDNGLTGHDWYCYSATGGKMGKRPPWVDQFYTLAGYAVFRDAWHGPQDFTNTVYLLFKCGFLSPYHRHDDDLSFILWAFGEDWLIDAGKLNYQEKDPARIYVRSARAHNTIIPQGKVAFVATRNMDVVSTGTRIIAYGASDNSANATGQSKMYPGLTMTRTIEYHKPYAITLSDRIVPDTHTQLAGCQLLFHIPMDKKIEIKGNDIYVQSPAGHQLRIACKTRPASITVETGVMQPEMQGWRSVQLRTLEESQCVIIAYSKEALMKDIRTEMTLSPFIIDRGP